MSKIIVSLATNDEHGNPTGRVEAVQIDDAIDLHWGERGSEPRYSIADGYLKLSRKRFPILGKQEWFGNWCWTGVVLDPPIAANLLKYLSRDDRWHVEGGWCDLTNAFAEGKITTELLRAIK